MDSILRTTVPVLTLAIMLVMAVFPGGARSDEDAGTARLERELRAAETAFAATMAARDKEAFASLIDEEAIFFSGDKALRGRATIVEAWSKFFEGEAAPFSWKPEAIAVLDSGGLGLSSGPVFDRAGTRIGTFNSIWRRTTENKWRIVFDRGCP